MAEAEIVKNIVVIGGTGTGKSSFINNLDLILRYATLEEAVAEASDSAKNFKTLIPVRTQFKRLEIVDGHDKNESRDKARSRTRRPKIYRIKCGNVKINLIDTPGMADSKGPEVDDKHVKHITTCLYQFKEIHGIVAFLKSSDNTLNSSLKYILNLVLSCLGTDAAKMISFVITHAGFDMNPGEAPNVIQEYLDELSKNPNIEYSEKNSYCFESSPLFYVLATKKGVTPDKKQKELYSSIFQDNVKELQQLLCKVFQRMDFYNVLSVPTLIFAKQIVPALACLFPFLDSMDEKIKKELDHFDELNPSEGSEYLKATISAWTDEYCQRFAGAEEKHMNVFLNPLGTLLTKALKAGAIFFGFGWIIEFFTSLFTFNFTFNSQQFKNFRERFRQQIEKEPDFEEFVDKIENEIARIEQTQSKKATLYEKFQTEKTMLLDLFCDLIAYLEEHAIVAFDDSGHGHLKGITLDLSSCIDKMKISGQWNPTSKNIEPEEVLVRLAAISTLHGFGEQIGKILSQCRNLRNVKYDDEVITLEADNVFIKRLLQEITGDNKKMRQNFNFFNLWVDFYRYYWQ